jgi:hypothetical protein
MIETLFSQDALSSPAAFALSLLIGVAFGFVLEQAGFGSSRRLDNAGRRLPSRVRLDHA